MERDFWANQRWAEIGYFFYLIYLNVLSFRDFWANQRWAEIEYLPELSGRQSRLRQRRGEAGIGSREYKWKNEGKGEVQKRSF